MKKSILKITSMITIIAFGLTLYAQHSMTVEELEKKAEKAIDPLGKLKDLKTSITTGSMLIKQQGITANLIIKKKYPNKSLSITIVPKMVTEINAFNGESSWAYSNLSGIRQVLGEELAFLKLQAKLDNPKLKIKDIFQTVTISEKKSKINNFNCYKLICVPKKEDGKNPITLYIDDKEYLLRQMDMIAISQMGPMSITTTIESYQKYDDILFAKTMISKVMGMEMVFTIDKVKLNETIKDSDFDFFLLRNIKKRI